MKTISQDGSAESKVFEENALKEINEAYSLLVNINIMDLSSQGDEQWEKARKAYDLKVDKVEGQITSSLRDKLTAAKNANEMFKVFSMFNALFLRPRIRGAIQEF
jgi:dynein heavy chain 1